MDAALAGRPGVFGSPTVDVKGKTVRVRFDPARTTPDEIAAWIETKEEYSCPEPGTVRHVVR